jgi:hypothetical protein
VFLREQGKGCSSWRFIVVTAAERFEYKTPIVYSRSSGVLSN